MAPLKVKIWEPASNRTTEVQLPDDVPISRLLPTLAEKLKIPQQPGGVTEYKLHNKSADSPYDFKDDDTLQGKEVKEGSLLGFTYTFHAG